jgi:two-component system osmolarity sensor histidine kinase EnvZ
VLTNLISNGIKHGGEVRLIVRATAVAIVDNGPGIPEQQRSQIFQPFFRLDSSRSAATGGSGLGLAIVDQLCQTHGWTIEVADAAQNAPLPGAQFTLSFVANSSEKVLRRGRLLQIDTKML